MLQDVLETGLRIVFCGTAAGEESAKRKMYYAGKGNKFWRAIHEVGLTPELLSPDQYVILPKYRIGLTDLVKGQSGMDDGIDFKKKGVEELRVKMLKYKPILLCFNGKRAGREYFSKDVEYGIQEDMIGSTKLFVVPSTSGAASKFWDIKWWYELERISRGEF